MVSAYNGPAYVYGYVSGNWTETVKLIPNDFPDANQASVDITPQYAVLGHRYEGHAGVNSGAAHVFVPSNGTWVQQEKLVASNAAADDNFGSSIAIDGSEVIVGALFASPGGVNAAGSAFAFNVQYPVSIPLDSKGKASYHDSQGNLVTVALTGPGTGTIYFDGTGDRDAAFIRLSQTTAASALTITAKGQYTTVGEIDLGGGSLKSLKAPNTCFSGVGLHSAGGSIAMITLGDIYNGADIILSGTSPVTGITLSLQDSPDRAWRLVGL
jgi:hypothetical protein